MIREISIDKPFTCTAIRITPLEGNHGHFTGRIGFVATVFETPVDSSAVTQDAPKKECALTYVTTIKSRSMTVMRAKTKCLSTLKLMEAIRSRISPQTCVLIKKPEVTKGDRFLCPLAQTLLFLMISTANRG